MKNPPETVVKNTIKKAVLALGIISAGVFGLLSSPVLAKETCVDTNLFGRVCEDDSDPETAGQGVYIILNVGLTVMTFGVGILGVIGIVIAGIQYTTARDNEQTIMKAKMRILQIVIGMAIWAALYVVLEWLMPGGLLGTSS